MKTMFKMCVLAGMMLFGVILTGCQAVVIGDSALEENKKEKVNMPPPAPPVNKAPCINKNEPKVIIHYHVIVPAHAMGFDPRYIPDKNMKNPNKCMSKDKNCIPPTPKETDSVMDKTRKENPPPAPPEAKK